MFDLLNVRLSYVIQIMVQTFTLKVTKTVRIGNTQGQFETESHEYNVPIDKRVGDTIKPKQILQLAADLLETTRNSYKV
jgi:predicted Rdx family selenoprotein